MVTWVAWLVGVLALMVLLHVGLRHRQRQLLRKRERYINGYRFPAPVLQQLVVRHPSMGEQQAALIAEGLRRFCRIHLQVPKRNLVMPSRAVDTLWHAFILDTHAYHVFCRHAFGRYFHHIPEGAVPLSATDNMRAARWRTWVHACRQDDIQPRNATRLPLLFAIDARVGWPDPLLHDPSTFAPLPGGGDGGAGGCTGSDCCGDGGGGCGGD